MKSKLLNALALIAIVAMIATTVSAQATPKTQADSGNELEGVTPKIAGAEVYIIQFTEPALPSYRGGVPGLQATSLSVTGGTRLDANSPASIAYRNYLANQQDQFITSMETSLGRPLNVLFQYQVALNGIAVELTPAEADKIAQFKGVQAVVPDWLEYPETDAGPAWVGAPAVWDGSATGVATMGEGIVIGILDTGINMDHPSFADVGDDGHDHINPRDQFYGWCNPEHPKHDPSLVCNDKLIGVWSGDDDSPEDYHGHGSHVGSTAAGNFLTATVHLPTTVLTRTISGVAPHANLIAYNIEGTQGQGSAPGSIIVAATEQAILDQVDVINYSFGGGGADPWQTAMHWLNVRNAGIFVATSAGNAGPDSGTIGSPANAPWLMSVANSSHDRKYDNALVDMTGGDSPPDDIVGKGLTSGYGPAEIVYAGWYTTTPSGTLDFDTARLCLEPFPAGTFDGEIVVCDRGQIARVDKGWNVLQGGAGGYVLANAESNGASIVADAHYLPGVHITYQDGLILKSWLTNTVVQTATITGYTLNITDANGDIVSASSSRGPNVNPDILKPNVTAPGTDILAAVATDHADPAPHPEFDFYGGTSMASPHVAGAGALLRALYPTWSPAQVQTALMSTAVDDMTRKEDGTTPADPFDVGAGRIDVGRAAQAGLVLEESYDNFMAANPATGGDPTKLNLASFADGHCIDTCVWHRTLASSLDVTETWTLTTMDPTSVTLSVEPMSFTLAPGASQMVTLTADAGQLAFENWAFGGLMFAPESEAAVGGHFPVAVKRVFANVPDLVKIDTPFVTGSEMVEGLEAQEITELTIDEYGLTEATLTEDYVYEDPDSNWINDYFSPGFGALMVLTETVTTPGADMRLVAEVITTASPDLDLFIVRDMAWIACQSATGATLEYCSIEGAALVTGTYHIVVQNYASSSGTTTIPDRVVLATALVPASDEGTMDVTGPESVPTGEPFDLEVAWDVSTGQTNMLGVDSYWYGAFGLGTDADNPGNLGLVSVDLVYRPDEMYMIYLPIVRKN